MPKSVRDEIWQYDIFISYARFDDALHLFVDGLAARLKDTFRELTGLELRLFIDRTEIAGAMLWRQRIQAALINSAAFIVVETPSYYTSEWCQEELDTFLINEAQRRNDYELLPYESLIFPVLRSKLVHPSRADSDQARRMREIASRQSSNFIGLTPEQPQYGARIDRLASDVVSVLQKLMQPDLALTQAGPHSLATRSRLGVSTPLVTTYSTPDSEKLIRMLAEAQAVTVIGISNEDIADTLETALERKRLLLGCDAFWDRLEIVFLAENIIPYVDDVLTTEFASRHLAARERARRLALSRRRLMSLLLRTGMSDRWTLYSYPYAPAFVGILFLMPDGKRLVQLRMMRPSRHDTDYLKIEFVDRVDEFFESAFREIVAGSTEEHEVILVGTPNRSGEDFICRGSRFRRSVLMEGHNYSDWVAAILAIAWRRSGESAEPLLQINAPRNSTREMGKITHVSGYINHQDYAAAGVHEAADLDEVLLPTDTAHAAVRRELLQDFGIDSDDSSRLLLEKHRFYYPDKENLFFYVFLQEIDSSHAFAGHSQMFPWTVDELLDVRRHHVLTNFHSLITASLSARQKERALEVLTLNLLAHGDARLADRITAARSGANLPKDLEALLSDELSASRVFKYSSGREIEVEGMAGLQYRAFFSMFLPAYASLGVENAQTQLDAIARDPRRCGAVARLAARYGDADFMMSLPIEV